MTMTDISQRALGVALLATASWGLAVPHPLAAQGADDERESYSYVRSLEGGAVLSSDGRESSVDAELNEPLLQGDLVTVERGARVEVVLADRSLLRVAGGSSVRLTRVAFSADRDDRTTRLDLDGGEILLTVGDDALGDELPEIRTPVATIYVHEPGIYRVDVDGSSLELVVREGYAEVLTDRGSTVVRGGESAWTAGDGSQRVEVAAAGPEDALERWGEDLERDVQAASSRELRVEPELAYAAAPLANYGSWVNVDTSWYWRPRVAVGWRPYWDGRWAWTPSGLTWVSYEPWGWVPYHYGTWTFLPHYGWVWRPGHVYSPAWVYWNIGPTWTGWCPTGYYTDYYRPYGHHGFRFGIYGWSGGSWGFYADWNFSLTVRVFDRSPDRWRHSGFHLARTEGGDLDRGVLTTDTSALPRERWGRPRELVDTLAQRGRRDLHGQRDLPDVSQFAARRRELPPDVRAAVTGNGRGRPLERGTPPSRGAANRDGIAARTGERPAGSRSDTDRGPASATARGRSGRETASLPSAGTPRRGGGERAGASTDRRVAPPTSTSDRQGWRSREAVAVPRGDAAPRAARGAAPTRPEPVQRVIGGLRREPGSARTEARGGTSAARQREQPGATLSRERAQPTVTTPRTQRGSAAPSRGPSAAARSAQPSPSRAAAPPTRSAATAPKAAAKPSSPPRRGTASQAKPSPGGKSDEKTSSPPPRQRSRSDATFVRERGRASAPAPQTRQRSTAPQTSQRSTALHTRQRSTAPQTRQRSTAPSGSPRVAVQRSRPSPQRATAPPARSAATAPRAAARQTSPQQRAAASQAKPGGGSRSGAKATTSRSRGSSKESEARGQRAPRAARGGGGGGN